MDLFMTDSPYAASASNPPVFEQDGNSLHPTPSPAQFTPQDSVSPLPIVNNASEVQLQVEEQPKKRARKGHSKSRTGCLNCKKARIKCKENKPSCDYCSHRALICEWPDLQINQQNGAGSSSTNGAGQLIRHVPEPNIPSPPSFIPMEVQTTGPVFTMQDFRLFTFFRDSAYPHHPIGNDSVWRNEVPCIASKYDFLLHSMLALSASELAGTIEPTPQMNSTALSHRIKAISALNLAISRGISTYEEGNAMLAACFSLLFQSCLLEDGLVEYMMFIRGTVSIGITMGGRRMRFIFDKLFDNEQIEQVDPMMQLAPLIQPQVVRAANRSFDRFKHMCVSKVEVEVFGILSSIARALVTSSRDAYMNLRTMYELFSFKMTQSEFQAYCNTSSVCCQLLQAHFVALQLVMAPVTHAEMTFKEAEIGKSDDGNGKTVAWLIGIHRRVPWELSSYFGWTMWVEKEVLSGKLYSGRVRDEDLGSLNEVLAMWNDDWGHVMNVRDIGVS